MKRFLLAVAIILGLAMTIVAPAEAHSMGMKWPTTNRYVSIYDGTGNYNWRVSTSAWEWNKVCAKVKFYMTKSSTGADVKIYVKNLPWPRIGETNVAYRDGAIIPPVIIYLDPDWVRRSTTRHELGHALGLAHNSLGTDSLMDKATSIRPHDYTDVRRYYGIRYTSDCPGGRWGG